MKGQYQASDFGIDSQTFEELKNYGLLDKKDLRTRLMGDHNNRRGALSEIAIAMFLSKALEKWHISILWGRDPPDLQILDLMTDIEIKSLREPDISKLTSNGTVFIDDEIGRLEDISREAIERMNPNMVNIIVLDVEDWFVSTEELRDLPARILDPSLSRKSTYHEALAEYPEYRRLSGLVRKRSGRYNGFALSDSLLKIPEAFVDVFNLQNHRMIWK